MSSAYRSIIPGMWISWVVYWIWASRHVKRTERREALFSRLLHVVPLLVAAWLLWRRPVPAALLNQRPFPWAVWEFWVAAIVTALGLLFTVWARVHIGRNWGHPMTQKDEPELVTSGPYHFARHPIYSGILTAGLGTAVALSWFWLVPFGVSGIYFVYAATVEERFLGEQFPDTYPSYKRSTKMLVPYVF